MPQNILLDQAFIGVDVAESTVSIGIIMISIIEKS
jgi:hypothetical protein